MDLFEIELQVGVFLTNYDLQKCTQVSKAWYQAFTPSLYSVVSTTVPETTPSIAVLRKHAHHIRQLRIPVSGPHVDMLRVRCNGLRRLDVFVKHMDKNSPDGIIALIRGNPRLHSLKFVGQQTLMPTLMMRGLSQVKHSLRKMHISELGMTSESLGHLLDAARQLDTLEVVIMVQEPPKIDWERWPCFPEMKILSLNVVGGELTLAHQVAWIRRCPNLDSLRWDIRATMSRIIEGVEVPAKVRVLPTKTICDMFRDKKLLKLHSLDLKIQDIKHTDADLEAILTLCPPLKRLRIATANIHYAAFRALERHFPTLEDLDVAGCEHFSSVMVQKVLTSCPRLKRLRADILDARDVVNGHGADEIRAFHAAKDLKLAQKTPGGIVKGKPIPSAAAAAAPPKPWVCSGLEVLIVCVSGARAPKWNEQVLAQIGKMTQLRELEVGIHPGCLWLVASQQENTGLDFRLSRGLRHLANLKCLEILTFKEIPQCMQVADAKFIAKSWPHLALISWTLHAKEEVARKLRPIILMAHPTLNLDELYEQRMKEKEGEEEDSVWEDEDEDGSDWEDEDEDEEEEEDPVTGSFIERLVETVIAHEMPSAVDYRNFVPTTNRHDNNSHILIDKSDQGPSAWPL